MFCVQWQFWGLCSEPLCGACPCFGGFLFAILGWRCSFKRTQKPVGDGGDVANRCLKRRLVGLGGLVEAGNLPYELERCSLDFFLCHRRIKVEKRLDISAHPANLGRWLRQRSPLNSKASCACLINLDSAPADSDLKWYDSGLQIASSRRGRARAGFA